MKVYALFVDGHYWNEGYVDELWEAKFFDKPPIELARRINAEIVEAFLIKEETRGKEYTAHRLAIELLRKEDLPIVIREKGIEYQISEVSEE